MRRMQVDERTWRRVRIIVLDSISYRIIGIGRSLTAPPSHTTVHTDHVYGGVRQSKSTWQMSFDQKIIAPCHNPGFIPYPLGQRFPLDGCITWVLHGEDLPLFSSPLGEPSGPSEITSPNMPSADFSPLVKKHYYSFSQFRSHATSQGTKETSRGKTQNFPCVDARFIKHAPLADGGLCGHVPTRPERTTPRIRFLFVAPHLWIGPPPDPTSR